MTGDCRRVMMSLLNRCPWMLMSLAVAAHGCQLRPNFLEDTVFNKRLLALVPTATRRSIP